MRTPGEIELKRIVENKRTLSEIRAELDTWVAVEKEKEKEGFFETLGNGLYAFAGNHPYITGIFTLTVAIVVVYAGFEYSLGRAAVKEKIKKQKYGRKKSKKDPMVASTSVVVTADAYYT